MNFISLAHQTHSPIRDIRTILIKIRGKRGNSLCLTVDYRCSAPPAPSFLHLSTRGHELTQYDNHPSLYTSLPTFCARRYTFRTNKSREKSGNRSSNRAVRPTSVNARSKLEFSHEKFELRHAATPIADRWIDSVVWFARFAIQGLPTANDSAHLEFFCATKLPSYIRKINYNYCRLQFSPSFFNMRRVW